RERNAAQSIGHHDLLPPHLQRDLRRGDINVMPQARQTARRLEQLNARHVDGRRDSKTLGVVDDHDARHEGFWLRRGRGERAHGPRAGRGTYARSLRGRYSLRYHVIAYWVDSFADQRAMHVRPSMEKPYGSPIPFAARPMRRRMNAGGAAVVLMVL